MLGWIKYLQRVRVETDALKRNKDLASTRTPLSLVRDEGVAGSNPATPTNTYPNFRLPPRPISRLKRSLNSKHE
jgi:hypothetical protein